MLITTPLILLGALGSPFLASAEPVPEPPVTRIFDHVMKASNRDGKPAAGRLNGFFDQVFDPKSRPDITGWADAFKFQQKNSAGGYLTSSVWGTPQMGAFKTLLSRGSAPTPVVTAAVSGTWADRDKRGQNAYLAPEPTPPRVGGDEVVVVIEEHEEVAPTGEDDSEEIVVVVEEHEVLGLDNEEEVMSLPRRNGRLRSRKRLL
ncbi:hypothetical protein B0H67DRAFT_641201 [Lasiosphaeris hirsuta]|uniref:Uncharacterized protein n=1 Tax=Lasiosphaeris hirsuta TaxID=260670 RepID=A0AA40AZ67_9PEZI|nr:hypothetical protein B0H67DRAFT_641201 [Lasiosphaeris hirsuta]